MTVTLNVGAVLWSSQHANWVTFFIWSHCVHEFAHKALRFIHFVNWRHRFKNKVDGVNCVLLVVLLGCFWRSCFSRSQNTATSLHFSFIVPPHICTAVVCVCIFREDEKVCGLVDTFINIWGRLFQHGTVRGKKLNFYRFVLAWGVTKASERMCLVLRVGFLSDKSNGRAASFFRPLLKRDTLSICRRVFRGVQPSFCSIRVTEPGSKLSKSNRTKCAALRWTFSTSVRSCSVQGSQALQAYIPRGVWPIPCMQPPLLQGHKQTYRHM